MLFAHFAVTLFRFNGSVSNMRIRTLSTVLFTLLLAFFLPGRAQDVRTEQAMPDTPMPTVENLELSYLAISSDEEDEDYDDLSEDFYPDWNTESLFGYSGVALPDTFVINLKGYCMPTTHTQITDVFGYRPRRRRFHYGLDVNVNLGDTIYAAFDGKVRVNAFNRRGYGYYVVIRHNNGLETLYGHLSRSLVKENDVVKAGEPIGLGGSTGRSTGPHLHFETRLLGSAINPALLFDFPHQRVTGDTYTYRKAKQVKTSSVAYYKVRQGDTLSKIASRNGTTVKQLCKLNQITQKSILRPGQVLRVK